MMVGWVLCHVEILGWWLTCEVSEAIVRSPLLINFTFFISVVASDFLEHDIHVSS